MIAVIFEVWPREGRRDAYLDMAAKLREELAGIDGFVSVERFQSVTDPDKMLSVSFFDDEDAVHRWRNTAQHRAAQEAGRRSLFGDYRIRIASVIRDYGMDARNEAPEDSRAIHDTLAPL